MIRHAHAHWIALVLAAAPQLVAAQALDTARSHVDFDLQTRWGATVRGDFPRFEGDVATLADGRRRVRVKLATASLRIAGSPRYAASARGPGLFDVEKYPSIEFTSDPYPAALARTGGALDGVLVMHGVSRRETFVLAPSSCAQPGRDCDVVAEGRVSRDAYGLTGWRWAMADRVRFRLRVRLVGD